MRRMAAHVAAARREHGCAVTITHVRDHATRSRLNAYTAAMGVTSVHAGATHPTCSSASRDIVARWHACPPFLQAVHSALLHGKDMVWQRFWRHLAAALGRHPRCMASVPPDKHASVVLARVSPPNRCGKASHCMGSVMSPILIKTTKGSYATLWQRRGDNVSAEETDCQSTTWWTRGCVEERLVLQGLADLWSAGTEVAMREHTTRGVTHAPRRRHWGRSNLAMTKGG